MPSRSMADAGDVSLRSSAIFTSALSTGELSSAGQLDSRPLGSEPIHNGGRRAAVGSLGVGQSEPAFLSVARLAHEGDGVVRLVEETTARAP